MKWILNDQSLNNIFDTTDQLLILLNSILKLRTNSKIFQHGLCCTRQFGNLQLTSGLSFSKSICQCNDKNTKSLILNWASKSGPFWDDRREENSEDYFEFEGEDVTEYGLGECARRTINMKPVVSISSFEPSHEIFKKNPLLIQHGIPEDIIDHISIENIWQLVKLRESIHNAIPRPINWVEMISFLEQKFDKLHFSSDIIDQLKPQPFNYYIVERLEELLGVLQSYVESRDVNGSHTNQTNEIINKHFVGKKAWFTDESDQNKIDFKCQLTFRDSDNLLKKIFAPFHGKIKVSQFRIHFPWPISPKDTYIKILYIGPKITKA